MIRLILGDDHTIFRQGMARLLQSGEEILLLGEAGNGDDAWQLICDHQPDVALLDVTMPGMSGMEVAKRVAESGLATRVVILTMHDDPALVAEALQAGVQGYVIKDNTFEELLQAVQEVAAGRSFISPTLSVKFGELFAQKKGPMLTPRERQVLEGIASGLTNKKIARALTISPKTVDHHRANIMEKLDLHTTADLVRYAIKSGIAV